MSVLKGVMIIENTKMLWKEKNKWIYNDDFIKYLIKKFESGYSINSISKNLKISYKALEKIVKENNIKSPILKNNSNFKSVYQSYDWCYQKYMVEGLNHDEMAKEANASKRVIEKWCTEKHKLTQKYRQENKQLNCIQKDIVIGSLLGDGHIDKRLDQPIFIISHAENQKDYLFWKYNIMKDFFNSPPKYYPQKEKYFKQNGYVCQPFYRISSRIHNRFIKYREMKVVELMNNLNELSFSICMLDDGYRGESNWDLCVAAYSLEEKESLIKILKQNFKINGYIKNCDNRYLGFMAVDSRKIDKIILNNLPNNLDIIKYKILNKKSKAANYRYVNLENGGKVGLSNFCRKNNISVNNDKIKELYDSGFRSEKILIEKYREV
ncbi:hypothetical protein IC213_18555 [Clostridioides sp. ES-S-0049-02]|uniref:hypothetical protein n=2 Tax=Clostridioides sp. ES-S-0049-02 TaxID=2770778 RepID=UPI001D129FA3|nr:hypothetical protein [Clostridioides sp. ES-S-0049-02]